MNGNKTLKEISVGVLFGASFIIILHGIQGIVTKGNWPLLMGCGVLLFIGTIIIAKTIEV
jgi:Mg/Co/Ni transporter MgtE